MAQIEVKVKLDLPLGVELLGYERCGDGHGFEVKFPLPLYCRCEKCGTKEPASYENKNTVYAVRDLDLWGQPSFLIFQPYFHRCPRCGHRQEHFAPFKRKKVMYTYRFEEYVLRSLIGSNEEEVAGRLGISAETVARIVENQLKDDKQIDPQREIKHVGMDELSLKKRHKLYVTVMTDLTDPNAPKVLAVARGRDTAAAEQCLGKMTPEQRENASRGHGKSVRPGMQQAAAQQPFDRGPVPRSQAVQRRGGRLAKKKPRGSTRPNCRRPNRSDSVR
jgi:transposase